MRPITVEVYERMLDAGILTEDDRVELLNGLLSEKTPLSPEHAQIVLLAHQTIDSGYRPRNRPTSVRNRRCASLRCRCPSPTSRSVPLGTTRMRIPPRRLLVIEVSLSSRAGSTSGRRPRSTPRPACPEYWVFDIAARTVHVHGGHRRATATPLACKWTSGTAAPARVGCAHDRRRGALRAARLRQHAAGRTEGRPGHRDSRR